MRTFLSVVLLGAISTSPAFLQDPPGGTPVSVQLQVTDAPTPWYVAGKPALLKIVAVDQNGRPSLMNGIVVRLKTSDTKSKSNDLEVGLVNGAATLKLQWFTASDNHSLQVTGTGGIKGETTGIKVQALPKDLKFKLLKPDAWPKYVWAGGYFKARGQVLTANDEPVGNVQVSFATSTGTVVVPGDVITDPDHGDFEFDCFAPEFICPGDEGGGGGGVNGAANIIVKCFVDANGNDTADDVEPGDDMPPGRPTEACPQELLPCALRILTILEEGGTFPPTTNGDDGIIVTGISPNGKPKGKERSDQAKLSAAKKFLQEQVIDFVSSGKWHGKFSDVIKRIRTVDTILKTVSVAAPVVQRLDCAIQLLNGNPDVKTVKLDVQERPGERIKVAVGFAGTFDVQSIGQSRDLLPAASFTRCFQPIGRETGVSGPAEAAFSAGGTRLAYHCLGLGQAAVSLVVAYAPTEAIVLPPPGNGVASTVVQARDVVGDTPASIDFRVSGEFTCSQVNTQIVKVEWVQVVSPLSANPTSVQGGLWQSPEAESASSLTVPKTFPSTLMPWRNRPRISLAGGLPPVPPLTRHRLVFS